MMNEQKKPEHELPDFFAMGGEPQPQPEPANDPGGVPTPEPANDPGGEPAPDIDKVVQFAEWQDYRKKEEAPEEEGEDKDGGGGGPPGGDSGDDDIPRPVWCADDTLATELVDRYLADDWRYVPKIGWHRWNGRIWALDETDQVHEMARLNCRSFSVRCDDRRLARAVGSARTIEATLRLAKTDSRIALVAATFDRDPFLLNTPDGIVDLSVKRRSSAAGSLEPHRRDAYLTQSTAASPGGDCPLWRKFLVELTGGDEELERYLQRVAGYILTGETKEEKWWFLYGAHGGEGKGVFLHALHEALGNYATSATVGMFEEHFGNDRHPTEIAALKGKRLVIAPEVPAGMKLDEAKVKQLTGRDPVSVRISRGDPFEYIPVLKMCMSGNHLPKMRSADGGSKRRFVLLVFTNRPSEPDLDLGDKLRAEFPGILAWAIEGCIAWQKIGLKPPRQIVRVTNSYFVEQNPVRRWFRECCDRAPEGAPLLKTPALYKEFKEWQIEAGEKPWREAAFTAGLRKIDGVFHRHSMTERGWSGLTLKLVREEFDPEADE